MEYYPPEFRVKGKYHAKSALSWSLGVILFTMLCGHFPTAEDLQKTELKLWSEPGLSKDCCHLICSLLQHKPKWRLSLGKILHHDWFQVASASCGAGRPWLHLAPSSSHSSTALIPQRFLSWLPTSPNFEVPEVPAMVLQVFQSFCPEYQKCLKRPPSSSTLCTNKGSPAVNIPKVPATAAPSLSLGPTGSCHACPSAFSLE
ncbi:serine threonine- kinase pim-2-like protein [Labeo rohita]|uniref:non-specific serine/threonine protein kinase n=1 Tax=Labeo rohita TaxID=84645 RepID=A0A498N5X9_LABRO|nr:serine threonine- kinase pim-2-like protein [Labeo rohita]